MTETERETEDVPAEEPSAATPGVARHAEGAADETRAGGERRRGGGGRRRRVCIMCADQIRVVDYKNVTFLRRFISDRGRIETRRKTNACAKHQRALAAAIKRARHLALLPYTAEHIRAATMGRR